MEWVGDAATGDEAVCAIEVVGNGRVNSGVEIKVNPDMDSELVERDKDRDDEIAEDEVNIVPDAADQEVNEAETSESELKTVEGGRLVPALVLASVDGPGESEVAETLEGNWGQRYEITLPECITLDSIRLRGQ